MTATLDQLVNRVRSASCLDRPDPNRLSETDIAIAIVDVGDQLITELNLTPEAWLESRVQITVQAGVSSYIINADDFSKWRYLFTKDPTDASFQRSKIPIKEREELTEFYSGGDTDIGSVSVKHNARAAAVYFDSQTGVYRIEFGPIPNRSAQYDLFYEPATERPQGKDSIGFRFPQFSGYVCDKAALRVLKACVWADMNPKDCKEKRAEIRTDLEKQIVVGDNQFRRFKYSMGNETSYMRVGFGQARWGNR